MLHNNETSHKSNIFIWNTSVVIIYIALAGKTLQLISVHVSIIKGYITHYNTQKNGCWKTKEMLVSNILFHQAKLFSHYTQ